MASFSGTWVRGDDTLTLRQLGTRVVGWLTVDGETVDVNGTLHEEALSLLVGGDEASARLSKGGLLVRGTVPAKGRWTCEPSSVEVVGAGLQALGETPSVVERLRNPEDFAGSWRRGGQLPQDTGSWEQRFELRVLGDHLTGRFHELREGWTLQGSLVREFEDSREFAGTVRDGACVVRLDGEPMTLRLSGEELSVDGRGGASGLYGRP